MSVKKGKEPEYITFMRDIALISLWPIKVLPHNDARICLSSYFRKGVIICNNSQASEWLYVIKQGTCRVLKGFQILKEDQLNIGKPGNYFQRTSSCLFFDPILLNYAKSINIENFQSNIWRYRKKEQGKFRESSDNWEHY